MYLFGGKFCKFMDEDLGERECTCPEIISKHPLCECDRKHFNNFLWATVTVFQVSLDPFHPMIHYLPFIPSIPSPSLTTTAQLPFDLCNICVYSQPSIHHPSIPSRQSEYLHVKKKVDDYESI